MACPSRGTIRRSRRSSRLCVITSTLLVLFAFPKNSPAAAQKPRTLGDIPGARESLVRMVSPKFYRSLLISPVRGWIVVRGQLVNGRLSGCRIAHSELEGAYDQVALDLANNLLVIGFERSEMTGVAPPVLLHVLIYNIADGALAISFAHLETAGGTQMRNYGSAWMAVEKRNHLWETIDSQSLAPYEKRGPRAYTLAIENPQAKNHLPRAVGRMLLNNH
jgi:hypothetical protein